MSENFNFIAFGNRDYVETASNGFEMSRGRMFEYTPIDIGKRLENSGGHFARIPREAADLSL